MSSSFNAYLLRIELKNFKPAIFREVLVDPNITLRKLHAVIQAAMWHALFALNSPARFTT